MPEIRGLLETVLYADDLGAMARFYSDVLGLPRIPGDGELRVGFRIGPESVLLVFDPALSGVPGRVVPTHGAGGAGHTALLIDEGAFDAWLAALGAAGVPIEQEHDWGNGVRSIYVRDPAGNSVELITGDVWKRWEAAGLRGMQP
jgi:catechol 2,3-dioxygenase-like lactoylglutathione lyase family enzyme